MKVHFIAIGGSAMHNLALALHRKGLVVSGSDDEIFEPARGRLATEGLLPEKEGWFPEKIHSGLDAIILGMHARADNPELQRAKDLKIRIFSYPEYLYEASRDKKRIVVGGSHGKTTITAMILHVLREQKIPCDYMVGAQLEGFDVMVRLTAEAPYMVIEGDEYLTSPIDRRPKFHLYHPDIALLSGIAWDHVNVFPTFEEYVRQFRIFIDLITPGGALIYCQDDPVLDEVCRNSRSDIRIIPYSLPEFFIEKGITILPLEGADYPLQIFGRHNLLNLHGASLVCKELGVDSAVVFRSLGSFSGASKRLELVASDGQSRVYKDFAHAPSKVLATVEAVREQFPQQRIVACLELHTFSSLSMSFLPHYAGTMDNADAALVYYNPHALQLKRLPELEPEQVAEAFANRKLEVFNDSVLLRERLEREKKAGTIFLMMSSGNYDGMDLRLLI